MTIRKRIDEAAKLARVKGFEEASIILSLVAVAGASRKHYPRSAGYQDGESFRNYLRDRQAIQTATYLGEPRAIKDVLYHQYRCALIHEAELARNVRFSRIPGDTSFVIDSEGITLGLGWTGWLISAVRNDALLKDEFWDYYDNYQAQLNFKENNADQWKMDIASKYPVLPGIVDVLLNVFANIGTFRLRELSNAEKRQFGAMLQRSPQSFGLNGGMITAISSFGAPLEWPPREAIFDKDGMTDTGVAFLDELLEGVEDKTAGL